MEYSLTDSDHPSLSQAIAEQASHSRNGPARWKMISPRAVDQTSSASRRGKVDYSVEDRLLKARA